MTKKIGVLLVAVFLLIAFVGCGGTPEVTDVTESSQIPDVTQETHLENPTEKLDVTLPNPSEEPDVTQDNPVATEAAAVFVDGLTGTFSLDTSGQFSASTCRLKQMDQNLMLFELDVMEGSEGENQVSTYIIAGTMLLNEQGTEGIYESDPDAENALMLQFTFDDDRSGFTLKAQDNDDFTPNGHYTLMEDHIEVSEELAVELIEQLPTAATSLNANLGAYTIECSENEDLGGNYRINAVFNDSGKTLASFLVTKDLSCVIRVDEDIEPILIWGSMPDAEA